MSASYPGSVKSFTTKNNGDTIQNTHVNDLQDEVNAVETDLASAGLSLSAITPLNFAPTLAFGGASVGVTYSANAGRYLKIGKLVKLYGRIILTSKGTSTGAATISLPFTCENAIAPIAGGIVFTNYSNMGSSLVAFYGTPTNNAATATLQFTSAASSNMGGMKDSEFTNTSDFSFSGFFFSA